MVLRLAHILISAALTGCACQSDYFHPCHSMTWEEMCRGDVACRTCLREGFNRAKREEVARSCWELVNGEEKK